ncbi:MAG: stage II sporulation protein M [Firmicutes bacterium]|nr:stage II sporulation protein M [Bacillota bacterium]
MGKLLKTKRSGILEPAVGSPVLLTTACFLFLTGIFCGVFTALLLPQSEKGSLLRYLNLGLLPDANAPAPGETFLHSLLNNLGLLLLIALLGLTIFGFPVAFAALAYKGMALGLSSVLILESMSLLKGSAAVFASLIPQNLLCIPAFVLAAAAAASLDMDILRHRKVGIKKALAQRAGDFLLLILFLGIVIAAGCCIESFISPFLLQLSK